MPGTWRDTGHKGLMPGVTRARGNLSYNTISSYNPMYRYRTPICPVLKTTSFCQHRIPVDPDQYHVLVSAPAKANNEANRGETQVKAVNRSTLGEFGWNQLVRVRGVLCTLLAIIFE